MRRKLQLIAVLAAWFLATGSQWDLIQVIGWGRMLVNNARTMSLAAAVRQTFDPQEMCGVCHSVQDAKRDQDRASGTGAIEAKAPLILQTASQPMVVVPAGASWSVCEVFAGEAERSAPPVPPPRVGLS